MAFDLEPLLEAFPQWRPLVSREKSDNGLYWSLRVTPPGAALTDHGLLVHTDNGEITVAFDFHHEHFASWYEFDGSQPVDSAVEFVRRLVGEEISVVSWWWNEQWLGSAQLENPAKPVPPSWASQGSWNRVRLRSWGGTYVQDSAA